MQGATLAVDIGCPVLADWMRAGRKAHRKVDEASKAVRKEIETSFGGMFAKDKTGPLAVLDDCLARRFYGHPANGNIDVSLCDQATRETAREVHAAMRFGGLPAAKLVAGRLLRVVQEELQQQPQEAPQLSPQQEPPPTRVAFISGHDTSLLALLNALNVACPSKLTPYGSSVSGDVWPPHTSTVCFELLDDQSVRVLYQFEELLPRQPMATMSEEVFDKLVSSEQEHQKLCGLTSGDGAAFRWAD